MPQRFLRPGITTSDAWNRVPWHCQSFFVRLLTVVDDYGRCDGRPSVLWGQCFAVWNEHNPGEAVDLQQVSGMLQQLAASGLITVYVVDAKPVIQIEKWQERIRAGVKERWPIPSGSEKLQQVAASCSNLLPSSPSPPPPSSPPPSPKAVAASCSKSKREPSGDHQRLIQGYVALFERSFGSPYPFASGRDGKAAAELLKQATVEEILELVGDAFTRTGYPFDCCETIAGTVHALPKLRAQKAKRNQNGNHRPNHSQNHRALSGAEQRQVGIPAVPEFDFSADGEAPPS